MPDPPVPPQAITAAAEAMHKHIESGEMRERILARLMLEAAAPHLAAAERERCAQVADERRAGYVVLNQETGAEWQPFAALLRKDPHAT